MKTKIEIIDISQIKENPNNPRIIKDQKFKDLIKSIKKFPEMLEIRPIVINAEMVTLGGNMRLKACKEAGLEQVPIIRAENLTEEKQKEFIIKDNVGYGEWNWDELANEWNHEDLIEWGLDMPEVDILKPGLTDEDSVPEPPQEPMTKLGDVWILGNHRLMCGDSTNIDAVEKLMAGQKADMVFTDPPYNIDYDFSENGMVETGQRTARFGKIKNDSMSDEDFNNFIGQVFSNLFLILVDGGSFYISARRESTQVFNTILNEKGFHIQSWLIWVKENFNISRLDYHPKHEVITYGWKTGKAHPWYSDRSQVDVLNFSREKAGSAVHPTQKPVSLIEYLMGNSSKNGDIVLDLFGGSGSTLIACEKNGRQCRLIELDQKYCDVIIKRWEDFTGEKAILETKEG